MRSTLSILAGFALWSLLWLSTNQVLLGVSPDSFREDGGTSDPIVLTSLLVGSVLFSVAAGYVTAHFAKDRALRCANILGAIQLTIGLFVQIGSWSLLPAWYHLCFLALLFPGIVAGARLKASPRVSIQSA